MNLALPRVDVVCQRRGSACGADLGVGRCLIDLLLQLLAQRLILLFAPKAAVNQVLLELQNRIVALVLRNLFARAISSVIVVDECGTSR